MKKDLKYLSIKKQIMGLVLHYKNKIKKLNKDLEEIEYEACPSGEMNESLAMMAPLESEIYALECIVIDLEQTLKT